MIEKKLAFIPGTKIVVTSNLPAMSRVEENISSETLEVHLPESGALITMLELLNKRLETLDLISVMLELERNLLSDINFPGYSHREIQIRENLSCVPKLQKRNNARSGENRSLPD